MMKNYTIIIVDDEEEVKNRIVSKIPADFGFEIVGLASNGYDALELIDKLRPNAVITDIRMPFIDGIQLAKLIRKNYPKTKIAFISGYNEFTYAKLAIELGVISYLSKPITESEVLEFLTKLKNQLDDEYQQVFNQERLDNIYLENLPNLIENQFSSLLQISVLSDVDLNRFKVFDIDLFQGVFLLGIIEIDHETEFIRIEQLRIFLLNLLKQKFSRYKNLYCFNTGFGLVFIINDDMINPEEFEASLYEVVLTKKEFSDIKIKIGVSNLFDDFKLFPNRVEQARKAMSYSNYLNIGTIIHYKDIVSKKSLNLQLSATEIKDISYVIKFGSEKEIHTLFQNLIRNNELREEYLMNKQYYIVNLVHIFIDFANSLHVEINDIVEGDIIANLSAYHLLSEVFAYLEDLVFTIRKANIQTLQDRAKDILDEAISYLNMNYADASVNLNDLCEKLGVSVSYLSALFKKVLETSFSKYLVKLRMEKAQEQLRFTTLKIYEIANKVGYNDIYYFSYSFKKYTGQSPKEYRNDKSV
jgi:two-component system, response regulator YesN